MIIQPLTYIAHIVATILLVSRYRVVSHITASVVRLDVAVKLIAVFISKKGSDLAFMLLDHFSSAKYLMISHLHISWYLDTILDSTAV